ncbi:MAG: N-acetylmuramoyl-L-alanine amidase, partial [Chlorobi bacterium]|nr:N-acetylmuramoyl-L-alanine amidase [Chlorobiota bacterium]
MLFVLFHAGCGPTVYFVKPPDWQSIRARDSTIAHFRPALQGKKFCLDPGHGPGVEDRRGPAGDVYEPEVNFRVALMLKRYLERAGASVILTRKATTNPSLEERKTIARQSQADFFISIHHNAAGNPFTNYT